MMSATASVGAQTLLVSRWLQPMASRIAPTIAVMGSTRVRITNGSVPAVSAICPDQAYTNQ